MTNRGCLCWPALALLALVFLTACGQDDSGHRFAGETIPTDEATFETPTVPPTFVAQATRPPAPTSVPAPALARTTGAVQHLFLLWNGDIWSMPVTGGVPQRVATDLGGSPLALATTSDGATAAVLIANGAGGYALAFVATDGAIALRVILPSSTATPVAAPGMLASAERLAWSPSNDAVLVGVPSGGVLRVAPDGQVQTLVRSDQAPAPGAVAWSPDGNAIAFTSAGRGGVGSNLLVGSTNSLPLDPAPIVQLDAERGRVIGGIAWLPEPVGIVYAQWPSSTNSGLGGDIFAISPSGGPPRLFASASVAAPVASAGFFAISPDATALAYTVNVPSGAQPVFDSLWLRQIDGLTVARLPAPAGETVTGLWWTTQGLVWATAPPAPVAGAGPSFFAVGEDGRARRIGTVAPPESPLASPIAQASPVASPRR